MIRAMSKKPGRSDLEVRARRQGTRNLEENTGEVLDADLRQPGEVGLDPGRGWPAAIAKQDTFNRKYQATGELIGAYGLADEVQAKLVRRENGQPAVTDGPYLETKEYIASFYLLDCESEERALQIAADMPWADVEPVEFWPIMHEAKPDL